MMTARVQRSRAASWSTCARRKCTAPVKRLWAARTCVRLTAPVIRVGGGNYLQPAPRGRRLKKGEPVLRLRINLDQLVALGEPYGPPVLAGWSLRHGSEVLVAMAEHTSQPALCDFSRGLVADACSALQLTLPFDTPAPEGPAACDPTHLGAGS